MTSHVEKKRAAEGEEGDFKPRKSQHSKLLLLCVKPSAIYSRLGQDNTISRLFSH